MKRKEAIEKIKALGPKDAISANNEKDAKMICDLMHEAGLERGSGYSLKKKTNRVRGVSMLYYGIDNDAGSIYYRNNFDNISCFNFIHPASDFLGGEEEESILDSTEDANQEIINEGLERLYGQKETNLHSSVNQMGDKVTQEIHFKCGSVRTIEGIMTNLIEQSMFTLLETDKGIRSLNTDNITYAIIKSGSNNVPTGPNQTLIFHLSNDHKVTIRVLEGSKKLGELIKYKTTDGNMILINTKNLNAIEEIK